MSKRDREKSFQGWFDIEDAYENSVVQAFAHLQTKFNITPKQVIAESVLRAARDEGFTPDAALKGMDSPVETLTQMLGRLIGMIENGSFIPANEAARQSFDEDTVQFDAISASVGGHYRPMSFEDED